MNWESYMREYLERQPLSQMREISSLAFSVDPYHLRDNGIIIEDGVVKLETLVL